MKPAGAPEASPVLSSKVTSGSVARNAAPMSRAEARDLFKTGAISGGMIPKLETCLKALDNGVADAHVLDGRVPHVLLLELFTADGTGTKIIS